MALDDHALDVLFRHARTHSAFTSEPVGDDTLHQLYDLLKWGPTSANSCPARFVFVQEPRGEGAAAARAVAGQRRQDDGGAGHGDHRLRPRVLREAAAAVPAHRRARAGTPASPPSTSAATPFRGGTLQGAYLIIAARALGLDCGPMGGFDAAKVDAAFFPDGKVKSNFLCNLGHGDAARLHPRNPRLDFDEACRIE